MKRVLTLIVFSGALAGQQPALPLPARDLVRAHASFKTDAATGKPSIATGYALVIGVGNFKDSRVTPLRYAESDAQEMFRVLISPHGGYNPQTSTSSSAAMPRSRTSSASWSSGFPKSRVNRIAS